MNYWLKNFGIAGLVSLLFTAMSTLLISFSDHTETRSGEFSIQFLDFARGWLILTLVLTPIVSGLRAGESVSAKNLIMTLAAAALFGVLLIAPFAFMEYWNNPVIQSGEIPFPFMLFFGLWSAPVIFFLGATPIVRSALAGDSVLAHPISLVLRVTFLAFLAILWMTLLIDQMPCFLGGVPGCD